MGRSITPTYRVETSKVTANGKPVHQTPGSWPTKYLGRPTDASLAEYVKGEEESTREGGVNSHLGETNIGAARVIRQSSGEVVATFERA